MLNIGSSTSTLVDKYNKQIRSVLKFAAVVWTAGMTQDDEHKLREYKKVPIA